MRLRTAHPARLESGTTDPVETSFPELLDCGHVNLPESEAGTHAPNLVEGEAGELAPIAEGDEGGEQNHQKDVAASAGAVIATHRTIPTFIGSPQALGFSYDVVP